MIFIDASALIAVIAKEVAAQGLLDRIADDAERFYSAMSRWEALAGLCRSHGYDPREACLAIDDFLSTFEFQIVAIGQREAEAAADAYTRYGRGRHRAALNMGDCFAYACAKSIGAKLIYIGDDFTKTDLA